MICRNEDTSSLMIIGGKSTNDSAFLQAYGKNNNLYPGVFSLNANIGNGVKSLVGFPDGRLTWNNNDLAGSAIISKNLVSNSYIVFASGLILQWAYLMSDLGKQYIDYAYPVRCLYSAIVTTMTQSIDSTAANQNRFTSITNRTSYSCRIITASEVAESSTWSVMIIIIGQK